MNWMLLAAVAVGAVAGVATVIYVLDRGFLKLL